MVYAVSRASWHKSITVFYTQHIKMTKPCLSRGQSLVLVGYLFPSASTLGWSRRLNSDDN